MLLQNRSNEIVRTVLREKAIRTLASFLAEVFGVLTEIPVAILATSEKE